VSRVVAGIHLEGPFLSEKRRGAHDPAALSLPDQTLLREMLRAGRGYVRQMTIAPELPGAVAMIELLVSLGVPAADGPTDANYAVAKAAYGAGASLATDLCNAMAPLHLRAPGPIAASITTSNVVCELIADGVHLDDGTVAMLFEALGPRRVALVSDSIAAAGMGDGEHTLGSSRVTVEQGVARLSGTDPLAGGVSNLLEIFGGSWQRRCDSDFRRSCCLHESCRSGRFGPGRRVAAAGRSCGSGRA
jgi:N-acetylglucosamine-6-phosphate deacetylase